MLAAEPYMIVFRFLHIAGGVIWVGSTFLLTLFIGPSAAELGPDAGPMLHKLVVEKRVTQVITTIAIITVTAGLFVFLLAGRSSTDKRSTSPTWRRNPRRSFRSPRSARGSPDCALTWPRRSSDKGCPLASS